MAVKRQGVTVRRDKPLVLIGFAEAMAAIESTWSLQEAGLRVAAFRRAGSRPALRHVRGVEIHEVPAPELDGAATILAVRKLCGELGPAAVLPLDDAALWVSRGIEDAAVPIAGGSGAAVDCALDKSIQIQAAEEAGLLVPPTQVIDDVSSMAITDGEKIEFPVMVKPARALYEVDGALQRPSGIVCADREEFARAASKRWPGTLLVQPLIRGTGEGLFGHMGPDGVIGWSAHRRVRMVNPQGSASSACQSWPVDKDLIGPGERFLSAIGWRGLFMLEFLRDADGKPWFMELNGRTWGSMALARRRGLEYPAWTVQSTLDPQFTPVPLPDPPDVLCRNLGLELVHLAFVARGPQSEAQTEWPRLRDAARDVFAFHRGDRLYNWNRSQPTVLAADLIETLRTYGGKMMRRRA
jgi:predicted ATP-grasp superfamily ATP-dependent carboligase